MKDGKIQAMGEAESAQSQDRYKEEGDPNED